MYIHQVILCTYIIQGITIIPGTAIRTTDYTYNWAGNTSYITGTNDEIYVLRYNI